MSRKGFHKTKAFKWIASIIITLLILINGLTVIHAYHFTHFDKNITQPSQDSTPSIGKQIKSIFLGMDIPRPATKNYPDREYEAVNFAIENGQSLDAWIMYSDSISKGMIILFHGYVDEKSQLLGYAYEFLDMKYNVMLVDFPGSAGSYGNQTTIGYKEAASVKRSFDFAKDSLHEENIYLLGFSMGAAAIIKAQYDYEMPVAGIIAEAAYGKMLDTIEARIRLMGFGALSKCESYVFTFWLGAINGFDAFEMNPEEYAQNITVPTLIACGGKDQYIPQSETKRIFDNLASKKKTLKYYPECIHELYTNKYPQEWRETMQNFLN